MLAACSNDDNDNSDKQPSNKEYIIYGHKFIDLGLSSGLLWADCNMGAISPENPGYYYSWGEVSPKNTFGMDNYKFYDTTISDRYTKYTTKDGLYTLLSQDDAATMEWGTRCRIPTKEDMYELCDECKWTLKSDGSGYTVKGPNGNSIFLPMTGFNIGNGLSSPEYGCYWTSSLTLSVSPSQSAFNLVLIPQFVRLYDGYLRFWGMCIRPVATK